MDTNITIGNVMHRSPFHTLLTSSLFLVPLIVTNSAISACRPFDMSHDCQPQRWNMQLDNLYIKPFIHQTRQPITPSSHALNTLFPTWQPNAIQSSIGLPNNQTVTLSLINISRFFNSGLQVSNVTTTLHKTFSFHADIETPVFKNTHHRITLATGFNQLTSQLSTFNQKTNVMNAFGPRIGLQYAKELNKHLHLFGSSASSLLIPSKMIANTLSQPNTVQQLEQQLGLSYQHQSNYIDVTLKAGYAWLNTPNLFTINTNKREMKDNMTQGSSFATVSFAIDD
jgi:hypothetical protein